MRQQQAGLLAVAVVVGLYFFLAAAAPVWASGVTVSVGGSDITNSLNFQSSSSGGETRWTAGSFITPTYGILSATFATDAKSYLSYSINVQNYSSDALAFAFAFAADIAPVSGSMTASSSYGGLLISGGYSPYSAALDQNTSVDGGSTGGYPEIQVASLSNGSEVRNLGVNLGDNYSFTDPNYPQSTIPAEYETVEVWLDQDTFNKLQMDLNFVLSGGGDSAILSGEISLDKRVPLPASVLFFFTGFSGFVGFMNWRKRASLA